MLRASVLIASLSLVWGACSGAARFPTAPTPSTATTNSLATAISPTVSPSLFFEREIDLTGTWNGSYTIQSCWPTTAPNSCSGSVEPGNITLTLTQSGKVLTGLFRSDLLGSMDVSGDVDVSGTIRLAGQRSGVTNCFSVGPIMIGVTGTVESWSGRINRTGGITASFKQTSRRRVSSCYYAMYEYSTLADDVRRDTPPAKTVIERP